MTANMLTAFLIIVAGTLSVSSLVIPKPGEADGPPACDQHWEKDKLLKSVITFLRTNKGGRIDPIQMNNSEIGFTFSKFGMHFHGEAKLYNGKSTGLSTVRENGKVDCDFRGSRAEFIARLSIPSIVDSYTGHVKFLGIGPTVSIKSTMNEVTLILQISQDINSATATLYSVTLKSQNVKLRFGNIPLLSTVLASLTSPIVSFFKTKIHQRVEPTLKFHLKNFISTLDIRKSKL